MYNIERGVLILGYLLVHFHSDIAFPILCLARCLQQKAGGSF